MTNPLARGISTGLLLVSCAAPPAAPDRPPVPDLETSVDYFQGSALEGPRADATAKARFEDVLRADFRTRWFEAVPAAALRPLPPETSLIAEVRGELPILPVTGLFAATRVAFGDEARAFLEDAARSEIPPADATAGAATQAKGGALPRSTEVARETAVVADGVTTAFGIHARREFDVVGEGTVRKHMRVQLDRVGDDAEGPAVRVSLVLEDADPATRDGELQREFLVLERALTPAMGPVVILMPSPVADDGGRALAVSVEVAEVEADAVSEEVARCRAAIVQAAELVRGRATTPTAKQLGDREVAKAFASLSETKPRSALRWLTSRFRAPLTQDLALTLTEAQVEELAAQLSLKKERPAGDSALAWYLESRAWRWLIAKAQSDVLEAVLESMLLQHAGEVGRYPSTIESFVKRSKSSEELQQRFVSENRLLLEDNDPSSRVRAFDWLKLRGLEPTGFDPLADAQTRKTVLARLAELASRGDASEKSK